MNKSVKNIDEFIAWTKQLEGRLFVYRGLANISWEVSSSAFRRIEKSSEAIPPPSVFQNYNLKLLENASLRGFREQKGRSLSDLELLALLQHNGAATCLIDFTTNALIALWFACQGKKEKEGKVIAIRTDNTDLFSSISYKDLVYTENTSIEKFLYKNKLWKWEPSHLSNRIMAQQSVFIFGQGKIKETHYKEVMIDGGSKDLVYGLIVRRPVGVAELPPLLPRQ